LLEDDSRPGWSAATSFGWKIDRALQKAYCDTMKTFTAVVERDPETNLYVGYIPGFPGAHSQGAGLDELHDNLKEVIEMLLEDGEPQLEAEFVGTQEIRI
jgi:predicted RNase H-like HicB family nuclease